jgi:hypothetical protein
MVVMDGLHGWSLVDPVRDGLDDHVNGSITLDGLGQHRGGKENGRNGWETHPGKFWYRVQMSVNLKLEQKGSLIPGSAIMSAV